MVMQQPNDAQWRPVRNTSDHLLVAAGAGTGKTFTVVSKILFLMGVELRGERVETPLGLGAIAAITYTNRAAADLKRKLRDGLRAAGRREEARQVDLARIGTIHSFCGEILREFALRTHRPLGGRVLDDGESRALTAEVVRDSCIRALEERSVAGLDALFGEFPVAQIGDWVAQLAGNGDRLERYLAHAAGADNVGPRERALLELARIARSALAERLRFEGALDFDTMIVGARDLLREEPTARRALQRRIRVLVVDEFQDVDPVQREIAYLLGEPEARRTDTPRLVFVGDPKQSIYRFRRADVAVWRSVEHDFETEGLGKVLPLQQSFRTVSPVLAWVDAKIGPILDRPVEGDTHQAFEVPFAPVRSTRSDGPADHAVEYLLIPEDDDGKCRRADERRRIEAEAVAQRMLELRAETEAALPADAAPEDRKIWGQMAILLASWSDLTIYQAALERRGIPTYPLRSSGFYNRREVVDLILALEVARNPRDDRALMGFLRSPFVGLRDDTLLAIARQTGRSCWDGRHAVRVAEQALLEQGFARVERLAALRDRIPTAELLAELLRETGFRAHLALLGDDGLQPLANVRKFLDFVASQPELGVGELLRRIADARDRDDPVEDARLFGEYDDVVTITSIHSAKGLEWRVVFWCDLARTRRADSGPLLLGRDTLRLGDPDLLAREQAAEWQALRTSLEHEAEAEQKRLWYVAATRARDRLILAGLPLGKGARLSGSPADELLAGLPVPEAGAPALHAYPGAEPRGFEAVVRRADPALLPAEGTDEAERPLADPGELDGPYARVEIAAGRPRHSATELLVYARCPKKHWFRYIAGLHEPNPAGTAQLEARGIGARVRGQIVHDTLERLGDIAELDHRLDEAIARWDERWAARDAAEQAALRTRLADEVRRVAEHPEFQAIAQHPTARRELGFLYIANADQHAVGSMDLVAATSDGLVVLDIKTNAVAAEAAPNVAASYAPQRDVYVAAAGELTGLPVASFGFQFSRPGIQLRTVGGEVASGAAAERFLRTASRIGRGVPTLATDPAHCVHCGYRAAGWCPGVAPVGAGAPAAKA